MGGSGVGLLPIALFEAEIASERLVLPFAQAIDVGQYWLTRLHSRAETAGMVAVRNWLVAAAREPG
jgi:LysR family transcriptional regulator of beta-lactamase